MTDEEVASDNIRKKLEILGLWKFISRVSVRTHDRIFFRADPSMRTRLNLLVIKGSMQQGHSSGGPHDMVFGIYPDMLPLEQRKSYREAKRPSLQVVVGKGTDGSLYGDADIDLSSPSMDVVGFFTHLFEVLTPGATNHKQLKKKVDKEYEKWQQNA